MFFKSVVVSLSLLLSLQPGTWASSSPTVMGQMVIEGDAVINGAHASKGGTVFVGDRIVTPSGANASLALTSGVQLILIESSSLEMKEVEGQKSVSLERGALAVLNRAATAPFVVEAGGARIRPGKLEVFAKTGTTEVATADRTVEVHEGETLEATMAPPAPPQRAAGAGSSSPLMSKFDKIVIITGVAAGATGLIVAVRALQKNCTGTPSPFKVTCN